VMFFIVAHPEILAAQRDRRIATSYRAAARAWLGGHWMVRLLLAPFRVPNRIPRVQRRLVVDSGTAAQFFAGLDRLGAESFRYPVSAERLLAIWLLTYFGRPFQ